MRSARNEPSRFNHNMCPLPQVEISSSNTWRESNSAFRTWLRSARCITALFFRRDNDSSIECPECKSSRPPADKENYHGIISHYLHIGGTFTPPKCDSCHTAVGFRRDPRDCDCAEALEDFVYHLIREGDSPWNAPDSTVLALSQPTL